MKEQRKSLSKSIKIKFTAFTKKQSIALAKAHKKYGKGKPKVHLDAPTPNMLTLTEKAWRKRRAVIEPTIGHPIQIFEWAKTS